MNRRPKMRPHLETGEILKDAARLILANARTAIEGRTQAGAQSIHDFRRCIKRWRALLHLIDPFIGTGGKSLRADARAMAQALGGARDAQAALDALDDLLDLADQAQALSDQNQKKLRARINAMRRTAETSTLTSDTRRRLIETLDRAAAAIDNWPLRSVTCKDFIKRLARGYRTVRRNLPEDWSKADDEALHALRKVIIRHRYQMDIAVPFLGDFGTKWVDDAQHLRTSLGKHQDLLVLAGLTKAHQPLAEWHALLLVPIAQRKAEHVRAAKRTATRMLSDKPKAFRQRLKDRWEIA
jgi:CHAD domain-containing protein